MDLWLEKFLAKSTTVTVFSDVDTPSPGFTTTTVSQAKEELGPGWVMDDVYPPLAVLRQALLTDEEWAAMSSWEKDVWEMFYRPDWERLACIEQILVDTPAAKRAQRHEEILEALRNLGASASVSVDHLDESHAVSIDAASSAVLEEDPEVVLPASTGFITSVPVTCSTYCSPQQSTAAPVLVVSSPPTPTEYVLNINRIHVPAVPLAMMVEFPAVMAATDSAPTIQMKHLYNDSEFFMPTSSHRIASMVAVHRPIPWPSFWNVHANGEETRPLPWPSFRFSVATGNISTSTGYIIIQDRCNSGEWRRLHDLLLFLEYSGSASDCGQQTHTNHAIVWLSCTIAGFRWLAMVRSLELKLVSIGYVFVTFSTVLVDSINFPAWTCQYLGVYTTVCIGSWSIAGCLLVVRRKYSVQSSTDYLIASDYVSRLLSTMNYSHLKESVVSSMNRPVSSCEQLSCALQDASYWPRYIVTGSQMNRVLTAASRGSHWHVPCVYEGPAVSPLVAVIWDEWILQPWDFGQHADLSYDQFSFANQCTSSLTGYFLISGQMQDSAACSIWQLFLSAPLASLLMAKFLGQAQELSGTLLYVSKLAEVKLIGMFHEIESLSNYVLHTWLSWRLEQEALRIGLPEHHPMETLQYDHLPRWAWKLPNTNDCCCAISFHVNELHDAHVSRNLQLAYSAISQAGPNLPLTRAYQFTCDPSEGSCSCVQISVNLQRAISLGGIGSLDWGAHQAGFSSQVNVTCSVPPILLLTHAYQLSILAPTMFTSACRNLDSIFSSSTARCALQVTSSELLVLIVAFGGGQGKFLVEMRIPSSLTGMGNLPDGCLFNAIKGSQKSWNPGISQSNFFNAYQLDFFCDLGCTKKYPLSWDPRGRYVIGLDRHMVLQLTWDPGIAAAAWGQAAFQGGRSVSNPLLSIDMGWCMDHCVGSAHLSATMDTGAALQRCKVLQRGQHPSWITAKRHGGGSFLPTSAL